MKYLVLKEHTGEKLFKVGDVREIDQVSASQLVSSGYLGLIEANSEKNEQSNEVSEHVKKPKTKIIQDN